MTTPKLSTAIEARMERHDRGMQTCFPAKVLKWSESRNEVRLEPQFVETWVRRDGVRINEEGDATIDSVPVCYPWYMSWEIPVGTFGLVICTKYSLDQWRQQLQRIDPGDLRRFTMSGATFHPVVIGDNPSVAQQFVALKDKVETELGKIKDHLSGLTCSTGTISVAPPAAPYTIVGAVGSSKVKAET